MAHLDQIEIFGQYSYYVADGICLGKETKENKAKEVKPHIQDKREIKI
jgi:hypothetical protein